MAELSSLVISRELANKDVDWYTLGFLLDVPKYKLDAINKEYRLDGELRCLIEVFHYLDISDCTPTWLEVIDALRSLDKHEVADTIAATQLPEGPEERPLRPPSLTPSQSSEDRYRSESRQGSCESRQGSFESRQGSHDSDDGVAKYNILVDEQISAKFKRLTFTFSHLLLHVRRSLEANVVTPSLISELQMIVEKHFGLEPLSEEDATVTNIFTRMQKELSFLNYHLFELLIQVFLHDDKELQREFHQYERQYKKFEKSSKMKHLKQKISHKSSQLGRRRPVRLKLKDYWGRHTLLNFRKLMENIMSGSEGAIALTVTEGCLCITWESTGNVLPLGQSGKFLSAVGVLEFSVGDQLIYRSDSIHQLEETQVTTESEFISAVGSNQMEAVCLILAISDDPTRMIQTVNKEHLEAMRNAKGWSMLHFACDRGYSEVVEAILATRTVHPDTTDLNGWSPLMVAINGLHIDTAKLLIKSKVDVNGQNTSGGTSLSVACQTGQYVILNDLLNAGADPAIANNNGTTPLMIASQRRFTDIVSSLIRRKVNLNANNKKGETAVAIASDNGHHQVVSLLVNAGANSESVDSKGYTPLMRASAKGFSQVVDILAGRVDVNKSDKGGLTALHLASQYGYTIPASTLLTFGANPLAKLKNGTTPFLAACDKGHGAVVVEMLRQSELSDPSIAQALVQDTTNDGKTALYYASRSGSKGSVMELLKHRADPNIADRDGSTPLMIASYKGFAKIAELLLKEKARVNSEHKSKVGSTALYLAADKGHGEVAELLLKHGAKPNITVASNRWTPLIQACAKGHTHIVLLLLEHKAKVDAQAIDGSTALHIAAMYGHKDICEALIDARASVDLKNKKGNTPWDVAVSKRHLEVARLLDITSSDTGYETLSTTTTTTTVTTSSDSELLVVSDDEC